MLEIHLTLLELNLHAMINNAPIHFLGFWYLNLDICRHRNGYQSFFSFIIIIMIIMIIILLWLLWLLLLCHLEET